MRIGIVFLVLMLAACSVKSPDYTREQWMQGSAAVFKDTSRERLLEAVEKLFRLADKNDVRFMRSSSGIKATRWALSFPSTTYYTWDIAYTETDDGVKADVSISVVVHKFGVASPPRPEHSLAVIDLFFTRLSYLLGQKEKWESCSAYETAHPDADSLEALCRASYDDRP